MESTKRWFMSKTVWGIVLTAVVAVADMIGVQVTTDMPDWLVQALELLGLVIAMVGRFIATKKIA